MCECVCGRGGWSQSPALPDRQTQPGPSAAPGPSASPSMAASGGDVMGELRRGFAALRADIAAAAAAAGGGGSGGGWGGGVRPMEIETGPAVRRGVG